MLKTDLLLESLLVFIKTNPLRLLQGRAHLKHNIATRVDLDTNSLPLNEDLVAYARKAGEAGRLVYLATVSNALVARKLSKRFAFISNVVGSDGLVNLKGARKAAALTGRFPQGFDYAGDSSADIEVWKQAKGAILVNTPDWIERKVSPKTPVLARFTALSPLRDLLCGLRPQQC